jgi:hypothetical protein
MDNKEEFMRRVHEAQGSLQNKLLKLVVIVTLLTLAFFAHRHQSDSAIPQNLGGTTPLEFGQ